MWRSTSFPDSWKSLAKGKNNLFPGSWVPEQTTRKETVGDLSAVRICLCQLSAPRARLWPGRAGMQGTGAPARQHPKDQVTCSSSLTGHGVRFLLPKGSPSPEEALAAFTGHGVEVKAGGSVSTDAADTGHVPVEVTGQVGKRCAGSHGFHL